MHQAFRVAPQARGTDTATAGAVESKKIGATLGLDARRTRKRLRLSQSQVSATIGVSRTRYAEMERGDGARAPLELWVKVGFALGRPLFVGLSRDLSADGSSTSADPRDAGHLAAQELVLTLARRHGHTANVELATRPYDPLFMADVVTRNDASRVMTIVEVVNRAGDLGSIARSTERKTAELERMAILAGGDEGPYRVARGWLLVDTAANRRLVATYPEFLRTRHPGSSTSWARAIADGSDPPLDSAIAWIDPRSGRIFPVHWKA